MDERSYPAEAALNHSARLVRQRSHPRVAPMTKDLIIYARTAPACGMMAVFTFPVTTVYMECLFSGMNLNKSKMRSSMLDGTVVAVLKARELTQVFGDDYNGIKEKAPT